MKNPEIIRRARLERLERLAQLHTLYHDKMRWAREYLESVDNGRDDREFYLETLQSAAYWRAEALKDYRQYCRLLARLACSI